MLPPFEIDFKNLEAQKKFISSLSELIEGHLMGLSEASQIEFNGINMLSGNKGILSLNPKLSSDYDYLKESLFEFLKEEGVRFKKSKENNNIFLPIGRFDFFDQFELAVERAKIEFSSPFVLNAKGFILFERNTIAWAERETLFKFNNLQHSHFVNNLWAN